MRTYEINEELLDEIIESFNKVVKSIAIHEEFYDESVMCISTAVKLKTIRRGGVSNVYDSDIPVRTVMSTLTELIDDIDNLFHGGTYPKAKEEHLRGYRLGINDSAQIVWKKLSEVMKESE